LFLRIDDFGEELQHYDEFSQLNALATPIVAQQPQGGLKQVPVVNNANL
jgi:hypothetical protein